MSKDDDSTKPEDFQKSLNDLFKQLGNANFSFPEVPGGDVAAPEEKAPVESESSHLEIFDFDYQPRDIKAYLDRFVIRQDDAKKALSIAVCDHYNHAKYLRSVQEEDGSLPRGVEFQKQNVIVVGPTGVGKTYLIKHIAELIGVPFVKADATKFSETGYVGGDVDDLVRELVQRANGDVELAEFGIVYIDEVDKLASKGGMIGRDVSGRGVQTTLLKLMEETEVPLSNPSDMKSQMKAMMEMQMGGASQSKQKDTINTRHILFIVSGAFSGLDEVIRKRSEASQIGFTAVKKQSGYDEEVYRQVMTQDFIDYGFEAEFVGRLPVRVVCETLKAKDLANILKYSEGTLLKQYEREFEAYGIKVTFTDDAIEYIAELAEKEGTGARALMTVMEGLLRDFKFELPGTSVTELVIDQKLFIDREKSLEHYRKLGQKVDVEKVRDSVGAFCRRFKKDHSITISFDDEALAALLDKAGEQGRNVLQICRQFFNEYQFGLKLVESNTGENQFVLPAKAVHAPQRYLSELVVASYKQGDDEAENVKPS